MMKRLIDGSERRFEPFSYAGFLKVSILVIFIFFTHPVFTSFAGDEGGRFRGDNDRERRELRAVRVDTPPEIRGNMSDPAWKKAYVATGFHQYEPHNDREASFQTEVRILYDDEAVYIAAKMKDPNPDSIYTELGMRNSGNNLNADQFWMDLSPYDDGQNVFRFKISASGVQTDINLAGGGRRGDVNWDAVWKSETTVTDEGWIAEMAIPYSALRFPGRDIQEWGVNFWREIRRYRETSSWNFVDRRVGDDESFMGLITGVKGIDPPLRMSFHPYVSGYVENDAAYGGWGNTFSGGMDVKYGIDESFTLDVTLIPDFGQVQTDEKILDLSPFEVKYDEQRQFFTEGMELFNRAGLFYSRRVGDEPTGRGDVPVEKKETEMISENPRETSLINATKLSGRTDGGLGIGFFNAMTAPSYAKLTDTITGDTRRVETQPFTNYNMVVFDQSLRNNSFVSLANTNVAGAVDGYTANVTGTEFRVQDASNMYRVSGTGALSQQYFSDADNIFGYKYDFSVGKFGGTFQYNYSRFAISDDYDQNDLGFLRRNNLVEDEVSFSHNIFSPFWRVNNLSNTLGVEYERLYDPRRFTSLRLYYNFRVTFDNQFFIMIRSGHRPDGRRDYFEPRVPGRRYKTEQETDFSLSYSTDYSRRVYFDGGINFKRVLSCSNEEIEAGFSVEPTVKVSDNFNFSYGFEYNKREGNIGYVFHEDSETVYFGRRDMPTLTNTLGTTYLFNNQAALDLDLRHYWSRVDYDGNYYLLEEEGTLDPLGRDLQVDDINYNAFTIDLAFTWEFAPGSQLSVVWKNIIDSEGHLLRENYFDNLNHIVGQPQINSFSLRVLYYLDYQQIQSFAGRTL